MRVPLIFSLWFMVAAYVVHVLDESLLGRQLCREGSATLVAAVFLKKSFLVQYGLLCPHDCKGS